MMLKSPRELAFVRSATEQLEIGANDDCTQCKALDDACPECQERTDVLQKLIDLESLVETGVSGVIVVEAHLPKSTKGGN